MLYIICLADTSFCLYLQVCTHIHQPCKWQSLKLQRMAESHFQESPHDLSTICWAGAWQGCWSKEIWQVSAQFKAMKSQKRWHPCPPHLLHESRMEGWLGRTPEVKKVITDNKYQFEKSLKCRCFRNSELQSNDSWPFHSDYRLQALVEFRISW